MTKNEARYNRKTYGDAGKLVGLIYEQTPTEYRMTSAEFTDEELKTLQSMLEKHLDEGIEIVDYADELNIEDLYQIAEALKTADGKQMVEGKEERQWLQQAFFALFMVWLMDGDILGVIQNGSVAYELIRPLGLYAMWFVRGLSSRAGKALLRSGPTLLIAALLPAPMRLVPPASVGAAV